MAVKPDSLMEDCLRENAPSADQLIRTILKARGITETDDILEFLSDKPQRTFDPFLLPDAERAAERIHDAMQKNEKICVYGDYDVDGVMAAVLICRFLRGVKRIEAESESGANVSVIKSASDTNSPGDSVSQNSGANPVFYIPSRFDEGYGLNKEALRRIAGNGIDLVVTVDCGSVSVAEVDYANEIGLGIVITDHHVPAERLPDCPLVNPKRTDSVYPEAILSGCGVAFKLMQVFRLKYYPEQNAIRDLLNSMLDLVAIATVADVVPLISENRTFVKYGLRTINAGNRLALQKLVDGIGLKRGEIGSYNIAFGIAPHINAAGRMESAAAAAKLFLTEDEQEMDVLISELIRNNTERRAIQDKIYEQCQELVENNYKNDGFLLLHPELAHEGVSGIVAGKIKNRYERPSVVLSASPESATVTSESAQSQAAKPTKAPQPTQSPQTEILKGSARSVPGVDVTALLRSHAELFLKLGGHAMAAGFSMPAENEELLRKLLNEDVARLLIDAPDLLTREDACDLNLSSAEANHALATLLEKFEPTGTENPRPLLSLNRVRISGFRPLGEGGKHLKCNAAGLDCIIFGHEELTRAAHEKGRLKAGKLTEGAMLTLTGTLGLNRWNGLTKAQFVVTGVSDR